MNIKALTGNVVVAIQLSNKENYNLTPDVTIKITKGFDFNKRLDSPSFGKVIDGEGLPKGADILIHHNSTAKTYEVTENDFLSEQEIEDGFKVYSIPMDMCFVYNDGNEWQPCKDFLITQRIFSKHTGIIEVPNERIKNRLLILKGTDEWDGKVTNLSGKVMIVTENSDYEIIYHNKVNKEESLIRTRSRELLAIDEKLTTDVKNGLYLVGFSPENCKSR